MLQGLPSLASKHQSGSNVVAYCNRALQGLTSLLCCLSVWLALHRSLQPSPRAHSAGSAAAPRTGHLTVNSVIKSYLLLLLRRPAGGAEAAAALTLLERTLCRLRSVRDRPCLIRRCSYLLVFGTAVQCRTWSARGHRLVQLTACVVPIDIWHAAPCQMPCGTADDPHARVPNVVIGTTDVW